MESHGARHSRDNNLPPLHGALAEEWEIPIAAKVVPAARRRKKRASCLLIKGPSSSVF